MSADAHLGAGANDDANGAAPASEHNARAFLLPPPTTTNNNLVRLRRRLSAFPPSPLSLHHLRRSFAADAARDNSSDSSSDAVSSSSSSSSSSSKTTKVVPIPLAQTGEGLKEVEVVAWRVAAGDRVEEFGPLCDVQSDKAAVEITSRFSGVVERLCCVEGDMVQVGATLCELRVEVEEEEGEEGEEGSGVEAGNAVAADSSPSSSASSPAASPPAPTSISLASPAVRRVARELGLADLASIKGTGPGGRVLKEDVERAVRGSGAVSSSSSSTPPSSSASSSASSSIAAAASRTTAPALEERIKSATNATTTSNNNDLVLPLRGYRRAMVSAMTASLSVPHFHFMDEYPVDKLLEARRALADDPRLRGAKLTLLPFVIKAISLTLGSSPDSQHAVVNASLSASQDSLIVHADHNIGVAVDTPRGLVVPVVKRVQVRGLVFDKREGRERGRGGERERKREAGRQRKQQRQKKNVQLPHSLSTTCRYQNKKNRT